MLDLVRRVRPDDAVVGEEIGPQPGSTTRRWIFDGIDGTHNFALGRPGWATAIALEVDGEIVVGLISAPALGRRWWATHGGGAWSAPVSGRRHASTLPATPNGCRSMAPRRSTSATVIVIPWEGFLIGWRDEVDAAFPAPELAAEPVPRARRRDGGRRAAGRGDPHVRVAVGLRRPEPDRRARPAVVFRDAWGGERFDTHSGVFTNVNLIDDVLAALADLRPPIPDRARLARTVSTPIGTAEEMRSRPVAGVRHPTDAIDVGTHPRRGRRA